MDPEIALAVWSLALALIAAAMLGAVRLGRIQLPRYAVLHSERDARGLKLLKDWLSPQQFTCYEQHKYFEVIGSDSARVYRIHHGTQQNVEELDSIGEPVCRWCFVPEGDLVAGDVMLAQKIALETSERQALAVANRFTRRLNSDPFR
jgi:hypothetical protein